MAEIDVVTLSTVWHTLQRVCREMRDSLIHSSTNILITRLRDLGYGVWDAQGRVVAIPEGWEEGKGSWLKDTQDKWYLDGISSLWVNVHSFLKANVYVLSMVWGLLFLCARLLQKKED